GSRCRNPVTAGACCQAASVNSPSTLIASAAAAGGAVTVDAGVLALAKRSAAARTMNVGYNTDPFRIRSRELWLRRTGGAEGLLGTVAISCQPSAVSYELRAESLRNSHPIPRNSKLRAR